MTNDQFKEPVMNRRPRRRSSAFTLMEVLLVLAILVVLGSLVGVGYVRIQQNSNIRAAQTQVNMLESVVKLYMLDIGSCPTTQQGLDALINPPSDLIVPDKWMGPYFEKTVIPPDPWNQPYQYESLTSEQFRIWSNGPDGQPGTPDDISTQL
jgi:general secretion pathway protein G